MAKKFEELQAKMPKHLLAESKAEAKKILAEIRAERLSNTDNLPDFTIKTPSFESENLPATADPTVAARI